jgi:hypothetical protein
MKRLSGTKERESVYHDVIEVAASADVCASFCMYHVHFGEFKYLNRIIPPIEPSMPPCVFEIGSGIKSQSFIT